MTLVTVYQTGPLGSEAGAICNYSGASAEAGALG